LEDYGLDGEAGSPVEFLQTVITGIVQAARKADGYEQTTRSK